MSKEINNQSVPLFLARVFRKIERTKPLVTLPVTGWGRRREKKRKHERNRFFFGKLPMRARVQKCVHFVRVKSVGLVGAWHAGVVGLQLTGSNLSHYIQFSISKMYEVCVGDSFVFYFFLFFAWSFNLNWSGFD